MSLTIRIDDEVHRALQSKGEAFVDTPNDVLRRLLALENGNKGAVEHKAVGLGRTPSEVSGMSQSDFRLPILRALAELGGRAKAAEVLDRIEQLVGDRLTDYDREFLPLGADIRWRKKAQFETLGPRLVGANG